jgi:cytochrome P450
MTEWIGAIPTQPTTFTGLLDPFDASTQQNPFAAYRSMRRHHPVLHLPDGTAVVSRHADVVDLLRAGTLSSTQEAGAAGAPVASLARHSRSVMVAADPPVHTRRREAVAPSLTPQALGGVGEGVDRHVADLVAALPTTGTVDLAREVTSRVPTRTLLSLLGLDHAEEGAVRTWTTDFSDGISPWAGPDGEESAGRALTSLADHLEPLLEARRRSPTTDLLSRLACDPTLEGDEPLQQAVLLCTAGIDTAADLLASAVAAVAADPALWAATVADRTLVPAIVEETLRCESPVQFLMRRVAEPCTVAEHRLEPGTPVLLAIGAANRDETVFTDAERFDPARVRRGERRHLAFGSGAHRCLGAPLARIQAAAVLCALADRHPALTLAAPVPVRPRLFFRGPAEVLVALGA